MKFIVFVILFLCLIQVSHSQNPCPIIPTPTVYDIREGVFELQDGLAFNTLEADRQACAFLEKEMLAQHGIKMQSYIAVDGVFQQGGRGIRFYQNDTIRAGAYSIDVENTITIRFGDGAGCFNAVNSLLQLFASKTEFNTIDYCHIEDAPKFEWRGLHLDVSRHFYTVEEVKAFIDLMALYKFNKFHWHLTDDQGWRIEIKKYPKLTEIGAWRDSTVIGHYSDSPREYKVEKYGGFYTQKQIREVVKYAKDRYVEVVPEIEMPGHSRAALAAYPELSCNGELQPVPGLWGIFDDIYCSKESSISFMKDVLSEVIDLFPSKYIHIGGDEAPKVRWKKCENCQKVISNNGLNDEHELQSYFIGQIDEYLTGKGKKLIGWDEILEGGLSPNAAVMSWRGEKGGIEAARQKHKVVMSPTTYCYFDYYQSGLSTEPLAIGGLLPLEKVYKFDPIPEGLEQEFHQYIMGGQANLWTEYIPNFEHLQYMAFPRALALIQGLWCEQKPDYDDFLLSYIAHHQDYLRSHNVNYSNSIHYPSLRVERSKDGIDVGFESASENAIFKVRQLGQSQKESKEFNDITIDENFYIERLSGADSRNVHFEVRSEEFEEQINYEFVNHACVGLPVTLVTEAHPKYNHNGSLNLVDGICGGNPWKGTEWLGFQLNEIEMIVDLLEESELSLLDIGFLNRNGSWIYLPESITVYGSINKLKWKKVGGAKSASIAERSIVKLKNKPSRYIKIVIEAMEVIPEGNGGAGNVPWTFIDEVKIPH